jgi:hypothetical protein
MMRHRCRLRAAVAGVLFGVSAVTSGCAHSASSGPTTAPELKTAEAAPQSSRSDRYRSLSATIGARAQAEAARAPRATAFSFPTDTFAFPNEIRSRHRGEAGLYANYCFVMARALRQFHAVARFEPALPKVGYDGYVERVKAVVARPPWLEPLRDRERVVIPGYANLREFSRAEEAAVKVGMGSRFWTLVHWTNWRITLPVSRAHQAAVAGDVMDDLAHGRLVQLLVTNWPKPELNHTVVAFANEPAPDSVAFAVWDPNDPAAPGTITFDRAAKRFFATRLYDTEPASIRVFRMYYSSFL